MVPYGWTSRRHAARVVGREKGDFAFETTRVLFYVRTRRLATVVLRRKNVVTVLSSSREERAMHGVSGQTVAERASCGNKRQATTCVAAPGVTGYWRAAPTSAIPAASCQRQRARPGISGFADAMQCAMVSRLTTAPLRSNNFTQHRGCIIPRHGDAVMWVVT